MKRQSLGTRPVLVFDKYDDIVADFGGLKPKNWRSMELHQHMTRNPNTGELHEFVATKSEVSENVLHVGEATTSGDAEEAFDYCIAVRDRSTGKILEIKPVALVNVGPKYVEDPAVFLGEKSAKKIDYTKDYSDSARTFIEKRKSLLAQFGSAKKKKMLKAAEERETAAAAQSQASVLMGASSAIVSSIKSSSLQAAGGSPLGLIKDSAAGKSVVLPPYNADATAPSEVYKLSNFLNQEELEGIRDEAETLISMSVEEMTEKGLNSLVIEHCKRFGWPKDAEKSSLKAIYLFYLHALATLAGFVNSHTKKVVSSKELNTLGIHPVIQANFKMNFIALSATKKTQSKDLIRYEVSAVNKDKMRAHAMTIGLLLEGFKILLRSWVKGLGSNEQRCTALAQTLGCRIERSGRGEAGIVVARLVGPPGNPESTPKKNNAPRRR